MAAPAPLLSLAEGLRVPGGSWHPLWHPRQRREWAAPVLCGPDDPAVPAPQGRTAAAPRHPGQRRGRGREGFDGGVGRHPTAPSPCTGSSYSSARPRDPTAPSSCPATTSGTGCWPRRGCATPSSWCTRITRTSCARICYARPSPWPRFVSCRSAILSTRSVRPRGGGQRRRASSACSPDLRLLSPHPARSSCSPTLATRCR